MEIILINLAMQFWNFEGYQFPIRLKAYDYQIWIDHGFRDRKNLLRKIIF